MNGVEHGGESVIKLTSTGTFVPLPVQHTSKQSTYWVSWHQPRGCPQSTLLGIINRNRSDFQLPVCPVHLSVILVP
eukprot:5471201-Pleurochrysis_carterae.AAC.1